MLNENKNKKHTHTPNTPNTPNTHLNVTHPQITDKPLEQNKRQYIRIRS